MIDIILILCTGAFLFILCELRIKANEKKESKKFFNMEKEKGDGKVL